MWTPRTRLSTQHPWRIRSRCINETIPNCIERLDDIYLFVHPNFWFVHFLMNKSRKSYLFLFFGLRSYAYLLDGLRRVVPEEVHEPLDPHGHCKSTETWAKARTEHHWYRAPRSSTPNARQMRVSPWDVLRFSRQFQIKLFSKEFLSAQRLNSSSRGKKTRRRRSRHELEQEVPKVSMFCSSSRIVKWISI